VRVIGDSGAGKTTFAAQAADRLGLPHVELDEVFWSSGWRNRPVPEALRLLSDLLDGPGADGWVVDGNWRQANDLLDGADVIVWLDFSRAVVMRRVIWRTVSRGITRRPLWHGNRERLSNIFRRDPDRNIIVWAWQSHAKYRRRYGDWAAADPRVLRLATPSQARRWLRALATLGG